jgi:flagellum-specific peptidoglycan hydrolase FlgJ
VKRLIGALLGVSVTAALLWPRKASAGGSTGTASSGGASTSEADRLKFIKDMLDAIQMVAPNYPADAKILIVAQAAYESAWGSSRVAREGFNPFNITRVAGDTRPVVIAGDLEYDASGKARPITQRFAAYGSFAEAVVAYLTLLSGSRYAGSLTYLEAGDVTSFITRLRQGGYFTLPLAEYLKTMTDMRASVTKRMKAASLTASA